MVKDKVVRPGTGFEKLETKIRLLEKEVEKLSKFVGLPISRPSTEDVPDPLVMGRGKAKREGISDLLDRVMPGDEEVSTTPPAED